MAVSTTEYIAGECRWCGNWGEIYHDNSLCEECDRNIVRCSVCKSEEHADDHCRHIFQTSYYEWVGAGIGIPGDQEAAHLKRQMFKLLDLMPTGFAADLRVAIRSGRFYTWLMAPLIGGGGLLQLNGMPARDGKSMLFAWGDDLIKIGESDAAEQTADAYRWLVTLYKRQTVKANRLTIDWLDEWIANKSVEPKEPNTND